MCDGGRMSPPLRWISANATAWLVGAAASVGVGVLALSKIHDAFASGGVQLMSPDTVTGPVTEQPTGVANPDKSLTPDDPSTSHASHTHGTERALTSRGGSFVARCGAGQVYLASWSPAPGYHADDVRRGPATEVRLTFEAKDSEIVVAIRCVAGVPQASIRQRQDDVD